MKALPTLDEINRAAKAVYGHMSPTAQYNWPQLSKRLNVDLILKHENHTPLGAFKVRGGLYYFSQLAKTIGSRGVICATRGNHGQSVAWAASKFGFQSTVVVPKGNSRSKNQAMRELGANLVEHGTEFQDALEYAQDLSAEGGMHMVPSFDWRLVAGVATYGLELLNAIQKLDVVYVPIGLGSGACGMISARDAIGVGAEIVGVVSSHATAYKDSFETGKPVEQPAHTKIADGVACRKPNLESLQYLMGGLSRIVAVTDDEVEQAMRDLFDCTHNVAEGAGAAALAAVAKEAESLRERRVAAILTGGNVDREVFARVLLNAKSF